MRHIVAVHLNRAEFHFTAPMLARQIGNFHRHGYGQQPPHAHLIQHVFKRLFFLFQRLQIFVFQRFRLCHFFRQQAV